MSLAIAALTVFAYGAPAPDEHAVGAIVPRRLWVDETPGQVLCSATLVSQTVALTAGHCVEDYARGTLELRFGSSPAEPGPARLASEIVLHPGYSPTDSAFDLAVIRLDTPVSVPPRALYAEAPPEDWIDGSLRAIGFSSGTRRTGDVVLEEVDENTLRYGPGPDMTCRGDSGGPVLAIVDGEEQIVGVTSSGDLACEQWGVAAQVDDGVVALVEAASSSADAIIDAEAICGEPCDDDYQCPGDLTCTDQGLCSVRGLEAGNLVGECTEDIDCDRGPCVAMGEVARCLEPCAAITDEPSSPVSGCRLGAPRHRGSGGALGLFGWILAYSVVRRRRSVPADTPPG